MLTPLNFINDHLLQERHGILQPRIYSSTKPVKPQNLTGKMQTSSVSRIQGPVTAPSWMKKNQKSEFRAFPILHLTEPLYIILYSRKAGILSISSLKTLNPVSSVMNQILHSEIQLFQRVNTVLSILDAFMHWIHTCVCRNLYPFM